MVEHREKYKGVEIVVRAPTPELREARAQATAAEAIELQIDGKPIVVRRNSGGAYIAAGFAYAPAKSLVGLAKQIVDHRTRKR